MPGNSFEPVLLDLHDNDDYYVLTAALEAFAADMDGQAAEEQDRSISGGREPHMRSLRIFAARSRRLRNSIEQQLQANAAARQAIQG